MIDKFTDVNYDSKVMAILKAKVSTIHQFSKVHQMSRLSYTLVCMKRSSHRVCTCVMSLGGNVHRILLKNEPMFTLN